MSRARPEPPATEATVEAPPEEVDALPVVAAPVRAEVVARPGVPVVAQAAAVAATSFAAGAVTAAVVRRSRARRAVRSARRRTPAGLPVVGSRSFLIDVHLLGRAD